MKKFKIINEKSLLILSIIITLIGVWDIFVKDDYSIFYKDMSFFIYSIGLILILIVLLKKFK